LSDKTIVLFDLGPKLDTTAQKQRGIGWRGHLEILPLPPYWNLKTNRNFKRKEIYTILINI
jgi:hypothetical protein